MAGANEVALTYSAEIGQLRAKLASIPDITAAEARKAVAALDKSLRTVATSQTRALATTRAMTTGMATMGRTTQAVAMQLPDVATQLAAGTSAMQVFVQQGLQVVQVNQGMMTVFSKLVPALGLVAGAVAVAWAGWRALHEEERQAEVVAGLVTDARRGMLPILEDTRRKLVDLAAATGQLSEAEADHARTALASLAQWRAAMGESAKKVAELHAEQGGLTTQLVDLGLAISGAVPTGWLMNRVLDGLTTSSAEYQVQIDALNGELAASTDALRVNAEVTEATTTATKKLASAKGDSAKAAKAEADAMRRLGEEQLDIQENLAALEEERLAEAGKARQMFLAEEIERTKEATREREQIAQRFAEEEQRLDAEVVENRQRLREQDIAESVSAMSGFFGAVGQLAGEAAESQSKAHRKAARNLFRLSQAAALADIAMNAAVALTKALAQLGPIAGPLAAAAITATAAAQAALVTAQEPPSFHGGGLIGPEAPASGRERLVTARVGEGVLTRTGVQRVGGPAGLAALNAGTSSPGTGSIVIQHRLGSRVIEETTYEAMSGSARVRRASRRALRTGRHNPYASRGR